MRILRELITNFKRFKTAGILNVVGLAVAFAAFAVIVVQLSFQDGYDKFRPEADHLFRVEMLYPISVEYCAAGPLPVGKLLKTQCAGVKDYFVSGTGERKTFVLEDETGERRIFKESLTTATSSFAGMLGMEIMEGDARQALAEPGKLMISGSIARKWFGGETAVGRQVEMDKAKYMVAAVYRDMPANSIFKNCCYTRLEETDDWNSWGVQTFVSMTGTDRKIVQQQIGTVKVDPIDQIFEFLHKKEQKEKEGKSYLRVTPLTDIFYDRTAIYDFVDKGDRRSAAVLLGVGILIILIAGINFLNFSISLAPTRMKAINTRKVLGATATGLRVRLAGEAVVYTLVAFVLSMGLMWIFSFTPLASLFVVSLSPAENLSLVAAVGGLAVLLGGLAGLYPAFYLTSFEPALVLKGSFVMTPKGIRLRNGLMAFQFVISIVLITCTLLMAKQYRFMQNFSVGYDTENVGGLALYGQHSGSRDALTDAMMAVPGVIDYTFADYVPGQDMMSGSGSELEGEAVNFDIWSVYKNFLRFFNIPLQKGQDFSDSDLTDWQIIVNETGMKKQPVLERYFEKNLPAGTLGGGRLIGVAGDVHYLSLRKPIGTLAIVCEPHKENYNHMFLKLVGGNMAEIRKNVEQAYKKLFPGDVFEFQFLDTTLQQSYEAERRLMEVISLMGGIAIVLALVGVYGLIIFNAQYKRKEIGVRKVNGATERQIMLLLNRNFFRLLAVSFIIACPLAWYAMSRWLEGFSYKTPIHWWIFLLAGLITLAIALLTISWQSWKAATENPVKALKTE